MEIYSNPVNYFVADFFGSPSMNLVAGEIVQANGGAALPLGAVRHRAARTLQGREARHRHARHPARSTSASTTAAKSDVSLPVRLVEPLGKDTLLYFDAGTERAFVAVSEGLRMADVRIGEQRGAQPGRALHLSVRRRRAAALAARRRRGRILNLSERARPSKA